MLYNKYFLHVFRALKYFYNEKVNYGSLLQYHLTFKPHSLVALGNVNPSAKCQHSNEGEDHYSHSQEHDILQVLDVIIEKNDFIIHSTESASTADKYSWE